MVVDARARYRQVRKVLWIVLGLNIAVALAKLAYGVISHSVSMQADGIHSLFDGTSNIVGLLGVWLASRPADATHPYGHGKFEAFTAAAIAVMLAIAGYTIGREAISSLLGHAAPANVDVGSFIVMVGTLGVNLFVTIWESRSGRRLGSDVLVADARHTLSDVMVSSGVIVGLILTRLGVAKADAVVALLVAVAIFATAISVLRSVGRTLGDASRLSADEIAATAKSVSGVLDCHTVRTRGSETHVLMDLHIVVAADAMLGDAHDIGHEVESALKQRYPQLVDVVVHVEPQRPAGS